MNEKNLFERTKKGSANVQRFYESKLHAWAFDCQQNQSRRFTLAGFSWEAAPACLRFTGAATPGWGFGGDRAGSHG